MNELRQSIEHTEKALEVKIARLEENQLKTVREKQFKNRWHQRGKEEIMGRLWKGAVYIF